MKFEVQLEPLQLLSVVGHFAKLEGTLLLYSGGSEELAQKSFLFLFPIEVVAFFSQNELKMVHTREGRKSESIVQDPWKALKDSIGDLSSEEKVPKWAGFFSYEMGAWTPGSKPMSVKEESSTPLAYFQRSCFTLILDHKTNWATLVFQEDTETLLADDAREWISRLKQEDYWKNFPIKEEEAFSRFHVEESFKSKEQYAEFISRVKEYILSGDVYQVNLSHRMILSSDVDPYGLFKRCIQKGPVPFSSYLYAKEWAILCCSPERFLKHESGALETRPIKGTAPRGSHKEEDERHYLSLIQSEKERAELLMITDLMRNDLGRVSEKGSVKIESMWECTAYTNVFHLSSTVRSQAIGQMHPCDILRQTFPGGSITGCPKLRAMEVISEIEGRPRGVYTGSIGYFCENGDFDFNIAIRCLTFANDLITLQLGGGILFDSDPLKEYEETLHKGNIFLTLMKTS